MARTNKKSAGPGDEAANRAPAEPSGEVLSSEELRDAVLELPERAEATLQLVRGREASEVKVRLDEPAAE